MARFKRPGETEKSAFGISYDADRDKDEEPTISPFNENENLALQEQRRRLPVYKYKKAIQYLVDTHQTTIIVGETGSGKTTQIPQYLHEDGRTGGGKAVVCTQPRRVAAMTVAARVAEEMGTRLGEGVGYSIRFEDVSTRGTTKIKFCTDGVLLREMMQDPLLSAYSVVMVDEAHERSVATDLLLGLLKKIQKRRSELRVIVSSATLEAQKIADFFNASGLRGKAAAAADAAGSGLSKVPAIVSVEGRTHPVQVHYLEEPTSDYVRAAVETAVAIHRQDQPGDILLFFTGQEECEDAVRLLAEEDRRLRTAGLSRRLQPARLYAGLPAVNQLDALKPPKKGFRKVVAATNIAETSITIEGICYVVDCMFAKLRVFSPFTGMESLLPAPISRASAVQRAGRAGRLRPGHCYRLCTEEAFMSLTTEATVPEVQRSELASALLQLKALGIDNIMRFDWLAPPPAEAVVRALELLHALQALDDDARLSSPVGMRMAELPTDPRLARALLAAGDAGCAAEVAAVVAMLSVQSVWAGHGDRRALEEAQMKFAVGEGDLITYLNVWLAWEAAGRDRRWCGANCINSRTMLRAADIRTQLLRQLRYLGVPVGSRADDGGLAVRKALAAGLFPNAAQLVDTLVERMDADYTGTNVYRLIRSVPEEKKVKLRIHQNSILAKCKPKCVLFYQVTQSNSGWYEMQDVLTIEPDWLPELAPHMYHYQHPASKRP